jgi:hypothetical protein
MLERNLRYLDACSYILAFSVFGQAKIVTKHEWRKVLILIERQRSLFLSLHSINYTF